MTRASVTDLARLGATVTQEAVAKARLIDALEAEAVRLEAAALDLGPGNADMKEIHRARAARHRARLAELKDGK